MRIIIEDKYLATLYENGETPGKPKFGYHVELAVIKRIAQMEEAPNTDSLRQIKSLHYEQLKGPLKGKNSIRVKDGFRLIFRVSTDGNDKRVEIIAIEGLNNHYAK